MKHTELPWDNHKAIVHLGTKGGFDICNCPDAEANAAFIVKAVNNHYQLLEALKNITERYVELVDSGDCGHWNPETDNEVIAARKAINQVEEK